MFWMSVTKVATAREGSIAARLTAWYALLSVVLIAFSGSILYWVAVNHLRQEDDKLLTAKISELRAVLLLHRNDYAALREEVEQEATSFRGIHLRVLNAQGDIIAESPVSSTTADDDTPFATARLQADERGRNWVAGNGKTYRVMSSNFEIGSRYTVHAAMSLLKDEQFLAAYRSTLLLAVAFALAVAIATGYFIARRGLQPASRLAAIVDELGAGHLHRRVGDEAWPSELRPLATNFDHLLARLEDSFARISRFSADIAHELRTPLHILRGEAEIALSRGRSREDYRACIESAMDEYDRLSRLVDGLLFLASTEQPDKQLEKRSLDLTQEIDAVCAFYQAMADELGITLLAGGCGQLVADPSLLRRALGNLVANALRHTPSGGRVVVEAKTTPNHAVEIVVSDTGCGIASEYMPRIFDRFYRVDGARPRQGKSTGLGLAIVRSIIQLHGGTVSIDSEPGQGTTVTLTFPSPANST